MLLGDAVAFGAQKYGPRPAVIFEQQVTSFAELLERTRRLSNGLLGLASPGDRVGILAQNRPEFVEAYYGVPMAGMALTFLNYRLNPAEIVQIVQDAEPSVLLVESTYLDSVSAVRQEMPSVRTVISLGADASGDVTYQELLAAVSPEAPPVHVTDDDVAWLIYTSGTTGLPKGAVLTHRNLLTALSSWMIETSPGRGEVFLMPFPLCHVAGYGLPGYCLRGSTLILQSAYEPEQFMEAIQRYRVTGTPMAPTMLNMLLQHPRIDDYDLSSLRTIAYGGSSMPVEVLRRAMRRFDQTEFVQGFGMTELAGNVLFFDADSHVRAAARAPELLAAAGRAMPLAAVRVVTDDLADVSPGQVGEVVVRGDQVMRGYWNNQQATDEAFAGGWFHTGDLARVDDEGFVYIVDRKKDMIVTGGENVYSRQVEEIIYRHPGVAEVAVIGLPDEHWGEIVCAVVVPRAGSAVSEAAIVDLCRQHLAGFKKPRRVRIADELPKNASGKVLKRQVREQWSLADSAL